MRQRRSLVMLVVAALLLVGCTERRFDAPEPGERLGVAVDVNEGDVILTAGFVGETPVAFLLSAGDRDIRGIPGPGGAGFVPYALNDAGAIVGALIIGSGRTVQSQAVRWTDTDGFTLLPYPGGTFQSWATDINASGTIVVNAFSPSGSPGDGAYVWQPGTGLARLTDPAGAPNGRPSVGEAINDQGVVVGASGNGEPAGRERAREWNVAHVPETLGSPGETSRALDINEAGTVVGTALTAPGAGRAAAWITAAHSFLDLGPGVANGLNDANVVVGQAERPGALPRANLWVVPTLVSLPLGDPASTRGSNANALNSRRAVGDSGGEAAEFFF